MVKFVLDALTDLTLIKTKYANRSIHIVNNIQNNKEFVQNVTLDIAYLKTRKNVFFQEQQQSNRKIKLSVLLGQVD